VEEIDANQNDREKGQPTPAECAAEAITALGRTGRGGRPKCPAPGSGSEQDWEYVRSHNLQNPENRREILADSKLRKVFGKDKVTMFEMNKHLTRHLK
jgi:SWIB/MDM2 domain